MKSLPDNINNNEIYHNYYTYNQLKNVLIKCKFIKMIEHSNTILSNICEYCGITQWSTIDKSPNIIIGYSNDNKICYARMKNGDFGWNSIFLNEWIGLSENKKVYRYIFKWFGNTVNKNRIEIAIGLITKDYNIQLANSTTSIGFDNNSFGWYYPGSPSYLVHNTVRRNNEDLDNITLGKGGIKDKLEINENEDNMYFMMEVNLLSNDIKFFGTSMKHIQDMRLSIPNLEKPFRVGVSFVCSFPNGIGLGLVEL